MKNNGLMGKTRPLETRLKISAGRMKRKERMGYLNSPEARRKQSIASSLHTGDKASNWKGGITENPTLEIKERNIKKAIAWNRANKTRRNDIQRIYNNKRRALLKDGGGKFTALEWESKKKEYGFCCTFCKKTEIDLINETGMGLTVDHKIPITKWKEFIRLNELQYECNNIENIQPLCRSCNCKKLNTIL